MLIYSVVSIYEVPLKPCDAAYKLVFFSRDVGNIHVVGRWGQIFKLLAGEDINGDHVNLGVTVLARLGSAHLDNLAGSLVDDHETVLS